jgi:hypothetical protein
MFVLIRMRITVHMRGMLGRTTGLVTFNLLLKVDLDTFVDYTTSETMGVCQALRVTAESASLITVVSDDSFISNENNSCRLETS